MLTNLISRWRWEFALAGAIAIAVVILAAAEVGHDRTLKALEKINSVGEESQNLLQFISLVTDAETAHRGFLLTKRDDYLEPYMFGVMGSKVILDKLLLRYQKSGDTDGMTRIGRIATLTGEKHTALELTLRHAKQGDMEQAMELFNTDIGLNRMAILRKEVYTLVDNNRDRERSLRQEAAEISKYSRLSVAAITATNIVLLVIIFRRLGNASRQKEQEAERLKEQQAWLDAQIRQRTAQLEDLSVHLQDALEAEKMRLARELHDELGAVLTAAKMDVAWVRRRLDKRPAEMDEKLERTLKNIDQGIMVKRRLIEDLRPSTLSSFGLLVATRELAEDSAARNEWDVEIDLPDAEPSIGPDTATALYRIIQESLTNATKYAQAKQVCIRLKCTDEELNLEIVDDGIGFRLRDVRPKALGLAGMRQRVQARGGSFEVASNPGEGCRVRVILPLKRNEACVPGPETATTSVVDSTA